MLLCSINFHFAFGESSKLRIFKKRGRRGLLVRAKNVKICFGKTLGTAAKLRS
jgi:hypothetical protein